MDKVDKKTRSRIMSRIRKKGNRSTERRVRAALAQAGVRGWRLHSHILEGIPDFFFEKAKCAIFIDGCFWHGCSLCYRRPKSRHAYWDWKLKRNIRRDNIVNSILRKQGIRVMRVWEHEVMDDLRSVVGKLILAVKPAQKSRR